MGKKVAPSAVLQLPYSIPQVFAAKSAMVGKLLSKRSSEGVSGQGLSISRGGGGLGINRGGAARKTKQPRDPKSGKFVKSK